MLPLVWAALAAAFLAVSAHTPTRGRPAQAFESRSTAAAAACDSDGNACLQAQDVAGVQAAVYQAVNGANASYRAALKTVSTTGLDAYWSGAAFDQVAAAVADLQARGHYEVAHLNAITVADEAEQPTSAFLHTCEHWTLIEYDNTTGYISGSPASVLVDNRYHLQLSGDSWVVSDDTAAAVSDQCPPPAADQSTGTVQLDVRLVYSGGAPPPPGTQRAPSTSPASGLIIAAVPTNSGMTPVASVVTAADGTAVLQLPAGSYWVYTIGGGSVGVLSAASQQLMPNGMRVLAWKAVDVAAGGDVTAALRISIAVP